MSQEPLHISGRNLISAHAQEIHKRLNARLCITFMSLTTVAYYLAVFEPHRAAWLVVALGIVGALINAFVTAKADSIRDRHIDLRADRWDAYRWLFNFLCLDIILVVYFEPSLSILCLIWTILLLAAQTDLYSQRYRFGILSVGLAVGVVLIMTVPQGSFTWREQLFCVFSMALIVYVFDRMGSQWIEAIEKSVIAEKRERLAGERAHAMARESFVGAQSKLIVHELNNLITVIDYATRREDQVDVPRLKRTMRLVTRLNNLLLYSLRSDIQREEVLLGDVLDDVDLLLGKELIHSSIELKCEIEPDARSSVVVETSGSLFLILRNLIKNAAEATLCSGRVIVRAIASSDQVLIEVEDNGVGMTEEFLAKLLKGEGYSTKPTGSGLGMKFVVQQCDLNAFELSGCSQVGNGTTFSIKIPHRVHQ